MLLFKSALTMTPLYMSIFSILMINYTFLSILKVCLTSLCLPSLLLYLLGLLPMCCLAVLFPQWSMLLFHLFSFDIYTILVSLTIFWKSSPVLCFSLYNTFAFHIFHMPNTILLLLLCTIPAQAGMPC